MRLDRILSATLTSGFLAFATLPASAQDDAPRQVLFTNVNIFNGVDGALMENGSVLVEGNLIESVSADGIDASNAYMVDGEGRTLMPGLIDMHSHLCIRNGMLEFRDNYDQMANGAYTALVLQDYLDQGFTTARDAG